MTASLSDRIAQGRGFEPADLVLKAGRVFDLITGDLVETDVAICGDTIVGVFGSYRGRQEVNLSGRILVPGFIDTHLHFPQTQAIASYGAQLLEWLNTYIFVEEQKFSSTAHADFIAGRFDTTFIDRKFGAQEEDD